MASCFSYPWATVECGSHLESVWREHRIGLDSWRGDSHDGKPLYGSLALFKKEDEKG